MLTLEASYTLIFNEEGETKELHAYVDDQRRRYYTHDHKDYFSSNHIGSGSSVVANHNVNELGRTHTKFLTDGHGTEYYTEENYYMIFFELPDTNQRIYLNAVISTQGNYYWSLNPLMEV